MWWCKRQQNFVCVVLTNKKKKTVRLKEYYERTNERTRGVSEHLKTLVRKATGSTPTLHCIVMRSAEAAKQDYSAMMCRESNDTTARPPLLSTTRQRWRRQTFKNWTEKGNCWLSPFVCCNLHPIIHTTWRSFSSLLSLSFYGQGILKRRMNTFLQSPPVLQQQ